MITLETQRSGVGKTSKFPPWMKIMSENNQLLDEENSVSARKKKGLSPNSASSSYMRAILYLFCFAVLRSSCHAVLKFEQIKRGETDKKTI